MNKILVIGAGGQLGHCLKNIAEKRNINNILFPDEQQADILDGALLLSLLEHEKPAYVINCAAYTAVDKAEDEADLAKMINAQGCANLAYACKKNAAVLIHISTDFVFEGNVVKLLTEEDVACPVNVYGQTKLAGEKAIQEIWPQHFIIRTSWLYSEYGNNFVKTMLRLGKEKDKLNIIADQVGTPTYGIDLAHVIITIIQKNTTEFGLYHYSNEGVASWFDFAKAIFDLGAVKVEAYAIPGALYPTKAKRPAFSVMDKNKIKRTFNLTIPYWRDSLSACIQELNKV